MNCSNKHRDTLGHLREVLAETEATPSDRKALSDSVRQLDELFLLVVVGEFNSGKSAFINALLGEQLQREGVTPTTDQIYWLKYGETAEKTPGERGIWVRTCAGGTIAQDQYRGHARHQCHSA